MKCYVEHTGMNFAKSFGPFDSPEDAVAWLRRPDVEKAGVRGAITPMLPPTVPMADVWNIDVWEEAT
jgi:hypothetical protein